MARRRKTGDQKSSLLLKPFNFFSEEGVERMQKVSHKLAKWIKTNMK